MALLLTWVGGAQAGAVTANPNGRMLGAVIAVTPATAPARAAVARAAASANPSTDLIYHGGPVMHADHAYSIYWEPSGHASSAAYKDQVDGYLADVAADSGKTTNVYASQTEYSDAAGPIRYSSTFAGRIVDTSSYPAAGCHGPSGGACLSDGQLQTELQRLVAANSLPGGESSMYLIFTPPGVDTCGDGSCSFRDFCAYHSWVGSGAGALIYTAQPYVAGHAGCTPGSSPNADDADATLNVVSHEQNEAVTDPEGTGWWDANGDENGDKCAWNFGAPLGSTASGTYNQQIAGHAYLLQQEWSNVASGCVQTSSADEPPSAAITVMTPDTPGGPFAFSATARDPDGTIVSYGWDFGDGQTASGAKVAHAYSTAGTYTVTVTVTDSDGRRATGAQTVSVVDQPVAAVTASAESALVGSSVAFDGTTSHALGGAITSYAWTFTEADGTHSTDSGARVTHVVLHPGTFEARLTVTDAAGSTGTSGAFVTVRARPPTAAMTTSTTQQYTTLPIAFDGTGSTGPDAAIASYSWSFGDGQTSSSPSPSHAYARAGAYPVTLTVIDTVGQTAAITRTVTAVNRPPIPIIALLPAAPTAGQPAALDGSASLASPAQSPAAVSPPPSGTLGLANRQSLARLRSSGLRFSVTCQAACRLAYTFVAPAHAAPGHPATRIPERLLARGTSALAARGTRQITARLSGAAIAQLRAMRRPRLLVTLTDPTTGKSTRLNGATIVG